MTDLERLLRSSLEEIGEAYSPTDPVGAKERFLKRRRRRTFRLAFSGAAVAAAALAALLFISTSPLKEDTPVDLASQPQPVATIGVKQEPVAAIAGADGVWVVERGSDSVSRIDPISNEVVSSVTVAASPDEVAAGENGDLWIAHEDGSVTHFQARGTTISTTETFSLAEGEDVHLDLAVTPDALIAVEPDSGAIFEISSFTSDGGGDITGGGSPRLRGTGFGVTDVSFGPTGLWFLDGPAGKVRPGPEVRLDGTSLQDHVYGAKVFGIDQVPGGEMADLAVGTDALWIANGTGGHVYRIDLGTGDGRSEIGAEIEVGGRYTDLAIGGGYVWALTGGDGPSQLRMIDETTGEVIGEPLTMDGRPTDVAFADDSAWITDGDGSQVIRVAPGDTIAPSPTPEEAPGWTALDAEDIAYIFSEEGDLYAERIDGSTLQLTDTARKQEVRPALSSDGDLIYEVAQRSLERLDLTTGEIQDLGEGQVPAFGPDGRFAWVINNSNDGTEIHIGPPGGEPTDRVSVEDCSSEPGGEPDPAELCPMVVQNLAWAPDGSSLFYEAGWEFGFALYQLSLDQKALKPFDLGAATGYETADGGVFYSAPVAHDGLAITVVRGCCFSAEEGPAVDKVERLELGAISFTEGGPLYESVAQLDIQPTGRHYELSPLGTLTFEGDRWIEGPPRNWILSDGLRLWLIDREGTLTLLRETAGNPSYFEGLGTVPR